MKKNEVNVAKKVKKKSASKKTSSKKIKVINTKVTKKKTKAVAKKSVLKKTVAKKSVTKKSAVKKTPKIKKQSEQKPVNQLKKNTIKGKKANSKASQVSRIQSPKLVSEPSSKSANKIKQKNSDLTNIVTPLDDRLFVELKHAERKTAGGLYIPDTVADVSGNLQGFVVCIGRGHMSKKGHLRPMDLRIGDQVVFSEHSGQKIEISNQEYIILREADVLGVITP